MRNGSVICIDPECRSVSLTFCLMHCRLRAQSVQACLPNSRAFTCTKIMCNSTPSKAPRCWAHNPSSFTYFVFINFVSLCQSAPVHPKTPMLETATARFGFSGDEMQRRGLLKAEFPRSHLSQCVLQEMNLGPEFCRRLRDHSSKPFH